MMLIEELSTIVGDAFANEGLDRAFGDVKPADRPDLAQFQCNGALAAAKAQKQNPRALGEKIAEALNANEIFKEAVVAGPGFINLTLDDGFLDQRLNALRDDERCGGWTNPEPEKIVLDYGGPNVAKPLHVGHLRTAIIGQSLKQIFRFVGDEVVGDVHLGDWGLPMGQLITELQKEQPDLVYFDEASEGPYPDEPPLALNDLERLYPQASAACKADDARAEEARRATAELQEGRPGYRALWKHFVEISRAAIEREYQDLGVSFELWNGESDAAPLIDEMATAMREAGLVEESDGAEIIVVAREGDKKKIPPLILFKSDGSVLYGTTDLATIVDRVRDLAPDRMIYVVDQRQALHFEQVFRAAGRAALFAENRLEHIGFGTMNGKDGKPFKTREGGVLRLRDLIDQLTEEAGKRLAEGGLADGYDAAETGAIARQVGIAALKFADLSNPRLSDYVFDVDRFVSFEGKTGPYLQYASVRAQSVLRKATAAGVDQAGPIKITGKEERDLALTLLSFGVALKDAHQRRLPHLLCEHAFLVAQNFSKFYAACRIVDEKDDGVRMSRVSFVQAADAQLRLILSLLGIDIPERM